MKLLWVTMIMAVMLSGCAPSALPTGGTSAPSTSQVPNVQATVDARVQATVQAMAAKATPTVEAASPTLPAPPPTTTLAPIKWNTSDMNVYTNGNIRVAARLISASGIPQDRAKNASPSEIAKAPWKYFGDVHVFKGTVGLVQEYPPDGPESKILIGGGPLGEIVMIDAQGSTFTPIDCMLIEGTGDAQVGDRVTIYGYVVGLAEVPNRLGGISQQLVVVGKAPVR